MGEHFSRSHAALFGLYGGGGNSLGKAAVELINLALLTFTEKRIPSDSISLSASLYLSFTSVTMTPSTFETKRILSFG